MCRIAEGSEAALIAHRTEQSVCFLPLRMEAPGHTVVATIAHFSDMYDVPATDLGDLTLTVQVVARWYRLALGATGFNLLHASGPDAQQSVQHLHVHVVPRWPKDGLDTWPTLPQMELAREREFERLRVAF